MAKYTIAPLSGAFTITGILGFVISAIYTSYGTLSPTWGFTLSLFFLLMVISSFISITPKFPTEIK